MPQFKTQREQRKEAAEAIRAWLLDHDDFPPIGHLRQVAYHVLDTHYRTILRALEGRNRTGADPAA